MKKLVLTAVAVVAMATGAIADTLLPGDITYGDGANVPTSGFATAYGANATAGGTSATAIGAGAEAAGGATAVGRAASATGGASVAIGTASTASGHTSIAVGISATVEAGADASIAIGNSSRVTSGSVNSVAIGVGSGVSADNSVALGAGTWAAQDNTVAVGNRRIVGVADGISATDAVNVRQLDRAVADIDRRIADGVSGSKKYAAQGTAAALAVSTVTFASSEDTRAVGVNVAHYGGEMALGVAGAVKLTPSLAFQVGFASPLSRGGSVAVRGGLSYSWR